MAVQLLPLECHHFLLEIYIRLVFLWVASGRIVTGCSSSDFLSLFVSQRNLKAAKIEQTQVVGKVDAILALEAILYPVSWGQL